MTRDLHRRLGLALFAVAFLVSTLVGGVLWFGHLRLENTLLSTVLQRDAEALLEQPEHQEHALTSAQGVTLYRASGSHAIAPELRALAPGAHRDVVIGGRRYHVLVGTAPDGQRYYATYDVSGMAHREKLFVIALALELAVVAFLSWWAGRYLSRRLLAPAMSVVERIHNIDHENLRPLSRTRDDAELGVIIDEINRLIAQIDERVQRERAFASAASHELRTPLTSIRIAAETALQDSQDDPARAQRILRAVTTATETLDALLATLRRNEPAVLEDVRLDTALQRWAEPYLPAGDAPAVHWQLTPVTVRAPSAALAMIFTNLLRNALRATPTGNVWVTLTRDFLCVDDDGEGIAPELMPHVFEPGTRGRAGGSGIGLYLAHLLAQRHGWTLNLENRHGGGIHGQLRFAEELAAAPVIQQTGQ